MNTIPCAVHSPLRHAIRKAFAIGGLVGLLGLMGMAPAFADDAGDVSRLLRAGQYAEGLSKADAFLSKNPRDAQVRFLKGVLLTELNRPNEAITIFTKLTEDFPDLPEPHNNLAVLYASAGQFDKARASLDMAIRTNPSYATAYENLGDVHARLASQAYDRALQLDSKNSAAKSKLTMLMNIGTANNKAVPVPAAPAAKPAAPAPAPVQVAQAKPAPAPAPVAAKPVPAPPPVAAAPAVKPVVTPPPAKPVAKPDNESEDVLKAVHGWARAWSNRNVKDYLEYYANDFQTPGGVSRKAWADERTARIQGKGSISVSIETPKVTVNGNTATVSFRQKYLSDRLTANSQKTLTLVKQGRQWVIKQERTGS